MHLLRLLVIGVLAATLANLEAHGTLAKEITNSIGMKLVRIEAGTFRMGSPASEEGRDGDEGPQHEVEITRPFYLGKYAVTVEQFRTFVQDTGYRTDAEKVTAKFPELAPVTFTWKNPGIKQGANHPVAYVSYNDALAFCRWLSHKEGSTYRLPTEAEWEYCCRAGSKTRFASGDTEESLKGVANLSSSASTPVGTFKPNAWGLYDMEGNVSQWCSDWYDKDFYENSPKRDPEGPARGGTRIVRGTSWVDQRPLARCAQRLRNGPDNPLNVPHGFRVVLVAASGTR
jgi:formylglycine-generating enzyme required for sulfatase activity